MSIIDRFVYFINERESIRVKKDVQKSDPPWTDDTALGNWRFCNVDRCNDTETKWIFKNIINAHDASPTVWFNLAIARFINWHPTLEWLGYYSHWDEYDFICKMDALMALKQKVYTGAYMVRAVAGIPKHDYLATRVFTPLWKSRQARPSQYSCSLWDVYLGHIFNMGDFMRNQIITDMKYSAHLPKDRTVDWSTFCLAGSGTRRGLNRLMGLNIATKIIDPNQLLIDLRDLIEPRLTRMFAYPVFEDLNNLSNCCCEFDKYMRLIEASGQPRSRYTPRYTKEVS